MVINCFAIQNGYTQEILYYINEGFEDVYSDDFKWISSSEQAGAEWTYQTGGYDESPLYAYEGDTNAFYSYGSITGPIYTLLESPPLDLSTASRPQLVFAHAQHEGIDLDKLILLFKAGATASWDTIEYYEDATPWYIDYELRTFNIQEIDTKYLCEDFQIGFLGVGNGGNGVCIDSVIIEEKDVIPKYIKSSNLQNVTHSIIPSGIKGAPILKEYINVFGNQNYITLNSITFSSASTNNLDFEDSGFNLYLTNSSRYRNLDDGESTKIAGPVSIVDGTVTFSGLEDTLFTGDNYLWLTVDVKSTATHDDIIDFYIGANGIVVSDTTFPGALTNPIGTNKIKESLLYSDFETPSGWSYEYDFEENIPQGFHIYSASDPDYAYQGDKIMGTDLSEDGAYRTNITPATAYHATTPTLNLKYYSDIRLYAQKWLSFNASDEIDIEISADGGTTWESIWNRKKDLLSPNESGWNEFYISNAINKAAKLQENFLLRLAMNQTHSSYVLGGWNLDNFAITGNHLETDVGIAGIISPYSDCIGTGNNEVQIIVRNYAEGSSPSVIPIYYTLDGPDGVRYYDTIKTAIPIDDSVIFTFDEPADLSSAGNVNFFVSIDLDGDEIADNDTMTNALFLQNNFTPSHLEKFEEEGGYWIPSDNSKWSNILPSGGVPTLEDSPYSWFLAPSGVYFNSDTSWITSSCYDLTGEDLLVLELKYWNESEYGIDGANIEYTVDDGETWSLIDSSAFGKYSNWYYENVSAIGEIGWSGSTEDWVTARVILPSTLLFEPKVKFRVYWSANEENSGRGFVFDDFSIYPAPKDIGVTEILTPVDACQFVNDGSVTVEIKNFGINNLKINDTIIIGVDLDGLQVKIDSVILDSLVLPGQTTLLDVQANLDLSEAKSYTLRAYTLNETDPYFYDSTSNDTSIKSFTIWPNPTIILADTIASRQPDTVVITPSYPDWVAGYTYYWTPGGVTTSSYDVYSNGFGDDIYKITVTEPVHSCSTTDSVNVLLLYFDMGIDSILTPFSDCEISETDTISVRVKNMGTDSILSGDEVNVYYQVDGGTINNETIILTKNLKAGHSFTHKFSSSYDFSTSGSSYQIDAWGNYSGGDKTADNDSASLTVTNYGYTALDIGPSSLVVNELTYTLDAGSGFEKYDWRETGDTTQTLFIDNTIDNKSGLYTVWATDINLCTSKDSIELTFSIQDIRADFVVEPVDDCNNTVGNQIRINIFNNGTDTIQTTDSILYSYQIDNGTVISEWAHPLTSIKPNTQHTYFFSDLLDFTAEKTYSLIVTASAAGDMRPANDTIETTFSINAAPVIDFGLIPSPITGSEYELDAEPVSGTGPFTFMWQDGETTTQTFLATEDANESNTFWVAVTDPNGCIGYDTAILVFDIQDFAVSDIETFRSNTCQFEKGDLTVSVANMGNKPRYDVNLTLGYIINESDSTEEDFTFTGTWEDGIANAQSFTFADQISFEENGTSTLNVYVKVDDDMYASNDYYTRSISVNEAPIVDFGGDTIELVTPGTLDPGEHDSYIWQDSYSGRYYTITSTNPATYTVTVTDLDKPSCLTTKSVYVMPTTGVIEYKNLEFSLYPNPASSFITIQTADKTGKELFIEIYSITNQLIWSDYHNGIGTYYNKLDISNFNEGVYLLRVRNANIDYNKRFIVK